MRSSAVAGLNARDHHDPGGTMGKVIADISMSLDGYVAGPDPDLEDPLGRGGEAAARVGVRRPELARDPRPGGRRAQRRLRRHRGGRERDRRGRDGPAHVQRRQRPVGAGPEGARLVGRRPAVPRAGLRAHPPRARAAADGGRDDLQLRHRRHRVGDRAGARGGGREGRARSPAARTVVAAGDRGGAGRRAAGPRRARVPRRRRAACSTGCAADVGLEIARVVDSPTVTHLRYRVVRS